MGGRYGVRWGGVAKEGSEVWGEVGSGSEV